MAKGISLLQRLGFILQRSRRIGGHAASPAHGFEETVEHRHVDERVDKGMASLLAGRKLDEARALTVKRSGGLLDPAGYTAGERYYREPVRLDRPLTVQNLGRAVGRAIYSAEFNQLQGNFRGRRRVPPPSRFPLPSACRTQPRASWR